MRPPSYPVFTCIGYAARRGPRLDSTISVLTCSRAAMEDAHTTVLNLEGDAPEGNTFFAVYDGHGGACFSTRTVLLGALSSMPFPVGCLCRFCRCKVRGPEPAQTSHPERAIQEQGLCTCSQGGLPRHGRGHAIECVDQLVLQNLSPYLIHTLFILFRC